MICSPQASYTIGLVYGKEAQHMRWNHTLALCLIAAMLLSGCAIGAGPASQSPPAGTPSSGASAPAPTTAGTNAGNPSSNTSQAVTITFAAQDQEKPIYEPLIAKFEQANPSI